MHGGDLNILFDSRISSYVCKINYGGSVRVAVGLFVSNNHVLTAAHPFYTLQPSTTNENSFEWKQENLRNYRIFIDEADLGENIFIYRLEKIYVPGNYTAPEYVRDVAILEVSFIILRKNTIKRIGYFTARKNRHILRSLLENVGIDPISVSRPLLYYRYFNSCKNGETLKKNSIS